MKNNRIVIFDTTLRDGEQCPGASMNLREKLEVARQLARLKVDVIEAGFPVISDGDFQPCRPSPARSKARSSAGLARCVPEGHRCRRRQALKPAGKRGRIHVFLATSKIHREFKLGKAQDEIIAAGRRRGQTRPVLRRRRRVFARRRLPHRTGFPGAGLQSGDCRRGHHREHSRHRRLCRARTSSAR